MEGKKPRGLFNGPSIIVTIIIMVPAMLYFQGRGWLITFLITILGFGAGHLVNHFYHKSKNK